MRSSESRASVHVMGSAIQTHRASRVSGPRVTRRESASKRSTRVASRATLASGSRRCQGSGPMPARFPLVRSIPIGDPLAALRAVSELPYAFLLHSSLADDRGRWSFFGADPFAVHRAGSYHAAL